jgi:hypothetical protein
MDRYRAKSNTIDKLHPETTASDYVQPDSVVSEIKLAIRRTGGHDMHIIYTIYEIPANGAKYTLTVSTESIGHRKLVLGQCRSTLRQEMPHN